MPTRMTRRVWFRRGSSRQIVRMTPPLDFLDDGNDSCNEIRFGERGERVRNVGILDSSFEWLACKLIKSDAKRFA